MKTQNSEYEYSQMVRCIREAVNQHVPRDATVLVVSKGDPDLLDLEGRTGWHFPQLVDGSYAGFYPTCSLSAIAQFETLLRKGADYFLIPSSAFWWWKSYPEFLRHIECRYHRIPGDGESFKIFSLREAGLWSSLDTVIDECRHDLAREPVVLDWNTGRNLADLFSDCKVFSPPLVEATLPYLDHTVDIVAFKATDESTMTESRRVASLAVIEFDSIDESAIRVERQPRNEAKYEPEVSIVLGRETGNEGLQAIVETLPHNFRVEIILVSDSDVKRLFTPLATRKLGSNVVIKEVNRTADNFIGGITSATAEILVFLSSHVRPLPGWLPPLLQTFSRNPDSGAVGGRLLQQDYAVYEAGGLINTDGSAIHFGQGDLHANAPPYSYLRTVDFCSSVLATKRLLFQEMDGFTSSSAGEDREIAYCSKIRSKGLRVYYQPDSCFVITESRRSSHE